MVLMSLFVTSALAEWGCRGLWDVCAPQATVQKPIFPVFWKAAMLCCKTHFSIISFRGVLAPRVTHRARAGEETLLGQ